MPLDPQLQLILDEANAPLPVEGRQEALNRRHALLGSYSEPPPEVASVTDMTIPVPGGTIPLRLYTPPSGAAPWPTHLYFHTGGFFSGDLDTSDGWCRELCTGAGCVVVSVGYRLAAQHGNKCPTAPNDGYAALRWVSLSAPEYGIDPQRLSIGGASSGNIAAVVALMARNQGGPALCFQLLELPATDLRIDEQAHRSIRDCGEGYMLTRQALLFIKHMYLAHLEQASEWIASPLLAPDLAGLPPALIMTAEYDPLRDEGEAYGKRLQAAGVPVTLRRWEGLFHGAERMTRLLPAARAFRVSAIQALRSAYGMETAAHASALADA